MTSDGSRLRIELTEEQRLLVFRATGQHVVAIELDENALETELAPLLLIRPTRGMTPGEPRLY